MTDTTNAVGTSDWVDDEPATIDDIAGRRADALAATPEAGVDWFRAQLLGALDGWDAAERELVKLREAREDY